MAIKAEQDRRVRHVVLGALVLLSLALVIATVLIGYHYLPGIWGEWVGTMVGLMTTPFFLEASFIFIGFAIVFLINGYRRKKEGDELVYLDQVDSGENLPEHAKWAIYKEKPLDGEEPSLMDSIDGAAAAEDWDELAEMLGQLTTEELHLPNVLEARIALAYATGKDDRARDLQAQLDELRESSK